MADPIAGQDKVPTGTDDGRIKALEAAISERDTTINRLRGTQGSNDRTITELNKEKELLTGGAADLAAQAQALQTDLDSLKATNALLVTQLEGLGGVSNELAAAKVQYSRLRIAAAKAGQFPIIASLIENNSLPTAVDDEAFSLALDSISGSATQIATQVATTLLSGAKPPGPGSGEGVGKTPSSLRKQANTLLLQKKVDEALLLMQEASALETQT